MKLIINEWSFLIVNGLISEAKYQDVIKKLKKGDKVEYTDKTGAVLNFEVIFNDLGQVYLKNIDSGVYKNNYFFITVSSLINNELQFKTINVKKNLPDNLQNEPDNVKLSEILKLFPTKKWRTSTFKSIDELIMDNESVDIDKPDNEDEKFKNYIKVTDLTDLYNEFRAFKEGTTYRFTLSNGGNIDLNLIDNKSDSLFFDYNSLGGAAKSYHQLINAELILNLTDKNIEQKVSSIVSDENVDSVYNIKFNKLKGDDGSGNRKYESITIKNIKEIDPIGKFNDEDKGDEEIPNIEELSDKEIDDMSSEDITKLVLSDPTFKAAFLSKPGFWKKLVGGKPKGILVAKNILKNFNSPSSSSKEDKKDPVSSFFKNNQEYFIQLTDKSFTRGDLTLDITKKYRVKAKRRTNINGGLTVFLYGDGFIFKVNKLEDDNVKGVFRATLMVNDADDKKYTENRTIKVTDAY